jgi:hypothetical protein
MIYSRQTKVFYMADKERNIGQPDIIISAPPGTRIEINFTAVSAELTDPQKRKVYQKEVRSMDPLAVRALAGYGAASLRDNYPNLVEFPPGDEPKIEVLMDIDDAGTMLYKDGFTVGQVSNVILALDSLSNLKANKQMEIQFKRVIVEAVNEVFPQEGKIDVDEYFGGRF